jgi:hypothetical protein
MEIIWTDRVSSEEILHTAKEERNILYTIQSRKANWIVHIFCRICLIKHVIAREIDGRIKATGRRERIGKQLLSALKEKRGY